MPFASINSTNPRTNLWNFGEKISRIGHFEKWQFWKIGHFEFFSSKKNFFFCFILMKISPNLYGRMDGSKFWCFPWFSENSSLCVILRYTVYIEDIKFLVFVFKFFWVKKSVLFWGITKSESVRMRSNWVWANLYLGFFPSFELELVKQWDAKIRPSKLQILLLSPILYRITQHFHQIQGVS